MSTATAFKFFQIFPFCLSSTVPSGYDYVGGLSLTQIMGVWWNLEDVAVATTGSFLDGPSDINSTFSVPASSVTVPEANAFITTPTVVNEPRERVCVTTNRAVSFVFSDTDTAGNDRSFILSIGVCIDPDDPDAYALFYRFESKSAVDPISVAQPGCRITNPESSSGSAGTPDFSGSLSFGGMDFQWVGGGFFYGLNEWTPLATGFSISITPSYFTY